MTSGGHPPESPEQATPVSEFFILLFRVLAGYLILLSGAILIMRRPEWALSLLDVCFWLVLLLLIGLRWRAARSGAGTFSALHLGIGMLIWASANSVQLLE